MKLAFILVGCQFTSVILGQSFKCFYYERTVCFDIAASSSFHNYSFVKSDSAFAFWDTTLFFNTTVDDSIDFETAYYCPRPSLLGEKMIIKNDGDNLFINKYRDSIYIPTRAFIHDTNFLVRIDSNSFYSTILDTMYIRSIFGIDDTVKVFRIISFDTSGIIGNQYYDGENIILSKSFGIVQGYDFYLFPGTHLYGSYPMPIILAGQTNPDFGIANLTTLQIFNFEIGDEFHYTKSWSTPYAPITNIKNIVLDKDTLGPDSIRYTIWTQQVIRPGYMSLTPPPSNDTTIGKSTVSRNTDPHFEILPSALSGGQVISMNDSDTKSSTIYPWYVGDCRYYHVDDCDARIYTYKRGLGLIRVETIQNPFCSYRYYEVLGYYNKSGVTSGTPIDFGYLAHYVDSILAGIQPGFLPDELKFIADGHQVELQFNFSEIKEVSIRLLNSIGQVIYYNKITPVKESYLISLPDNSGIYLLEVSEGTRRKTFRVFGL